MKRSLVADFLQAKEKLSQKNITASQSMENGKPAPQHKPLVKKKKQWEMFVDLAKQTWFVEEVEIEDLGI